MESMTVDGSSRLLQEVEIVVVVLLLSLPAPVQLARAEAAPSLNMIPSSASPGEMVTVAGSGFTANGEVQIFEGTIFAATTTATSAGTITTPALILNMSPGQYSVSAKDMRTLNLVQTTFTVEPATSSHPLPPEPCHTCVPDLNYTVTIRNDQPMMHVQLKMTNPNSTALTLGFRGGAWYVERYIHNLSAIANGKSLNMTYEGQGLWMTSGLGESTTIEYDVEKSIPAYTTDQAPEMISTYFNDQGGVIMPTYFFISPSVVDASSITVKFNVPAGWQIVTPYPAEGDHFKVQRATASLLDDFLNREGLEMGVMKYYAQEQAGNCTIEFGILKTDYGPDASLFGSQADLEKAVNVSAQILERLTDLFGGNPYKVFVVYSAFRPYPGGPSYPNEMSTANTVGYWPENRRDELVGHMFYAFMGSNPDAGTPLVANQDVKEGMGELYYGPMIAWRMSHNPLFLGKLYHWYMVYERFYQSNTTGNWQYPVYVKAPYWVLMLDNETQRLTGGAKSLDDVVRYLYSTYKNTGHIIDYDDIQNAMQMVTGKNVSDLFSQYVNGNEEIPYRYVEGLKPYFLDFPHETPMAKTLFNMTIPLFINIELALHEEGKVEWNVILHADENLGSFATYVFSHYKIENLTAKDVEDALGAITGANCSGFFTHWQDSFGSLSLGEVKLWLQGYSQSQFGTVQLLVNGGANGEAGGLTSPSSGAYMYHTWENVTVLALPNQESQFSYWLLDGNNIGNQNPVTMRMNQSHILTPVFSLVATTSTSVATTSTSTSRIVFQTNYAPYIEVTLVAVVVAIVLAYLLRRRH